MNLLTIALFLLFGVLAGGQNQQAVPSIGALLPKIDQEYYKLTPNGDNYHLRYAKNIRKIEILFDLNPVFPQQ